MEYNENPTYINIFENGAAQSKRLLELSLGVQRGDTLQTPIYMKSKVHPWRAGEHFSLDVLPS